MYILVGVLCFSAFALDFILLPIYFSKTFYCITDELITKNSGMIFTAKQLMKKSSVQYISVIKLPLSDYTAFNFIIIHALGGTMLLSFLSSSDTEEIAKAFDNSK